MHRQFASHPENDSRPMYLAPHFFKQNVMDTAPHVVLQTAGNQSVYPGFDPQTVAYLQPSNGFANIPPGLNRSLAPMLDMMHSQTHVSGLEPSPFYPKSDIQTSIGPYPGPVFRTNDQMNLYPPRFDSYEFLCHPRQQIPYFKSRLQTMPEHFHAYISEPTQSFSMSQGYYPSFATQQLSVLPSRIPLHPNINKNPLKTISQNEKSLFKIDFRALSSVKYPQNPSDKRVCLETPISEKVIGSLEKERTAVDTKQSESSDEVCLSSKTELITVPKSSPSESKRIEEAHFHVKTFNVRKTQVIELVKRTDFDGQDPSSLAVSVNGINSKFQNAAIQSKRVKAFWNSSFSPYPDVFKRRLDNSDEFDSSPYSVELIDLSKKALLRNWD